MIRWKDSVLKKKKERRILSINKLTMEQKRHIFVFGELLDAIYKSGIVL